MYVYKRSEENLYTVGFFKPDGKWVAESDQDTKEEAAVRVNYLNGGQHVISLQLAALMIAQGMVNTPNIYHFDEIPSMASTLAKAVLQEANK